MRNFIEEIESIIAERDAKLKEINREIRLWWISLLVVIVAANAPLIWAIYKQYNP